MTIGQFVRVIGVMAVVGIPAVAQQIESKPKADGMIPATYRSYIVFDQRADAKSPQNRTGKLHDLVTENNLNPVVAVFATKLPTGADEPVAKLVKRLKDVQNTHKAEEFGAFLIFAALDRDYVADAKADAAAEAVQAWAGSVQPGGVAVGLTKKPDGKEGDALTWGLAPDTTTIIVYNRMKQLKRWDLPADGLTDAAIDAVITEANGLFKKK
jgi:hypothetical protein